MPTDSILISQTTESGRRGSSRSAARLDPHPEGRHQMLATMDLATATPDELQRLLAIDQDESRTRTRRRRASARLEQDD
jgi:hypothetical protein